MTLEERVATLEAAVKQLGGGSAGRRRGPADNRRRSGSPRAQTGPRQRGLARIFEWSAMILPQTPMTIPHSLRSGGEAHADAIQRHDAALDDQERLRQDDEDAQGSEQELSAGVELSAANERVAASKAWLSFVERGY